MGLLPLLQDEVGEYVALKMVHHDDGDIESHAHGFRERGAHKQRTQEAGPAREGDRGELGSLDAGAGKSFADHRHYVELMGAGR